jgi:hypothetical protein
MYALQIENHAWAKWTSDLSFFLYFFFVDLLQLHYKKKFCYLIDEQKKKYLGASLKAPRRNTKILFANI